MFLFLESFIHRDFEAHEKRVKNFCGEKCSFGCRIFEFFDDCGNYFKLPDIAAVALVFCIVNGLWGKKRNLRFKKVG